MEIDWKSKLSSRKLWAAVAGFITGIVVLFGGNGDLAGGAVVSLGSVIAYILGEAMVDSARAGKSDTLMLTDDGGDIDVEN